MRDDGVQDLSSIVCRPSLFLSSPLRDFSVKAPNQNMASNLAGDIKAMLAEESAVIREAHLAGAGGSEIVQRRTGLIDRTLREAGDRLSAEGSLPSLVAIGGYGRGELNSYSDIDI